MAIDVTAVDIPITIHMIWLFTANKN